MHDDPAFAWLTGVESLWSGHNAALTARLARPAVPRLTEEQEALALGIAERLVLGLAEHLPLASEGAEIWARWATGGLPASAAVAPVLMARVEEFRWRRMPSFVPAHPGAAIVPAPATALATAPGEAEPTETELAYLAMRIADAARSNALGQPLLPPGELPAATLRALLLDIAAQDLALVGDGGGRAGDMAQAIDAILSAGSSGSIDEAARRYLAGLQAIGIVPEAAKAALDRCDWLAVTALLAAVTGGSFARVAAALLAAKDHQILAAVALLGVKPEHAGPLIDALADVPARLDVHAADILPDGRSDTAAAVTARAAHLRDRGA
jgi:hypothetical protein